MLEIINKAIANFKYEVSRSITRGELFSIYYFAPGPKTASFDAPMVEGTTSPSDAAIVYPTLRG
jgi:hypothetical protein